MGRFIFDFADPTDTLAFRELLDRLPPKDRRIAEEIMKGRNQSEVALVTGIPQRTVCRRLKNLQKIFGMRG